MESVITEADEQRRIIRCNVIKNRGDVFKKNRDYDEAIAKYRQAIAELVGRRNFPIPTQGGIRVQKYIEMSHWERIDLMACCNAIAECFEIMGELERALMWLQEVEVLYKNMLYSTHLRAFADWMDYSPDLEEYFVERLTTIGRLGNILFKLGNTSAACKQFWIGQTLLQTSPPDSNKDELTAILRRKVDKELAEIKHPDPDIALTIMPDYDSLQVNGSWKKLHVKTPGGMTPRLGFASWIWKSRLYIAGGEYSLEGPHYRDLWCLDLNKMDKWRKLPKYPLPELLSGTFTGWPMVVHEDKAYLFNGTPQLDVFDLKKERWDYLQVEFLGTGKWASFEGISDFLMQVANGKIYLFGGTIEESPLGCNLLVEFDLAKKTCKVLSGTVNPEENDHLPGPRRSCSGWVDKEQKNLYIMCGEANRQGAWISGKPHGAKSSWAYDDLWSWNFESKKWTKENILGNPPCARSEMGSTYNSKLDKFITFGGYSPGLYTHYTIPNQLFDYAYLADTFLYDPSTSRWKQILTRGFPTYRAQAHLISDPDTGKIYLFGGYTNSEFIYSRHHIARSFGDLWQLRVDMDGGFYEEVDPEEEARTAKAGPWQRCFNCGAAGYYKKCGGACGGRAFFCDMQCMKEGWKEHKAMHNCRKA
ncbi:hypothetical protein M422DRAFT_155475 [Sphaerobolus stellatus SS14]|nr:hypothetical protein M422DRAFT_155475 [Sphaerobolus stellatus SS14]